MNKRFFQKTGNMRANIGIETLESRRMLSGNGATTVDIGDTRYFVHADAQHGAELWKSDLDGSNATLVKDIQVGAAGSSPIWLTSYNGKLIFSATGNNSSGSNREPWVSDGTDAGTFILKEIYGGAGASVPHDLQVFNGRVIFLATAYTQPQLYSTDGTSAGTIALQENTQRSPQDIVTVGNKMVYEVWVDGRDQTELWQTDGTLAGTEEISGARIVGRQLRVYGTSSADNIELSSVGGITTVDIAGTSPLTFNESQFDSIVVHGLGGDDSINLNGSVHTTTQLYGEAGQNTLTNSGGAVSDGAVLNSHVSVVSGRIKIQLTAAADIIHISKNEGTQRIEVTLNGVLTTYAAEGLTGIDISASDGNDAIDLRYAALASKVYGGAGNDFIYGSNFGDRIYGGDGNDWIDAGDGNDIVYGEAGNDRLFGGNGQDHLDAGGGINVIRGGAGIDRIFARKNIDDYRSNKEDILAFILA